MQNSDICVIWQTHRLDARSLDEYWRLEKDCQGKFDTLVLYDNSRGVCAARDPLLFAAVTLQNENHSTLNSLFRIAAPAHGAMPTQA